MQRTARTSFFCVYAKNFSSVRICRSLLHHDLSFLYSVFFSTGNYFFFTIKTSIKSNVWIIFCKSGYRTLETFKMKLFATILHVDRSPEFASVKTINRRRQFHFICKLTCSSRKGKIFFISVHFIENILWTFLVFLLLTFKLVIDAGFSEFTNT